MRRYWLIVVVGAMLLPFTGRRAAAVPPDDPATCSITCTVGDIMEWSAASFSNISLAINAMTDQPTGSAALDIYLNGNAAISADNTAAAELDNGGSEVLTTEYSLTFDGDGATATGGSNVAYQAYASFLAGPGEGDVTHVSGDGNVNVSLGVRASVPSATEAPDTGSYTATQTLTAAWVG